MFAELPKKCYGTPSCSWLSSFLPWSADSKGSMVHPFLYPLSWDAFRCSPLWGSATLLSTYSLAIWVGHHGLLDRCDVSNQTWKSSSRGRQSTRRHPLPSVTTAEYETVSGAFPLHCIWTQSKSLPTLGKIYILTWERKPKKLRRMNPLRQHQRSVRLHE